MVRNGLGATNPLYTTVGMQHKLLGSQPAVVVESHGVTMGAGIVDAQGVTVLDFRQPSQPGELVVVFT